MSIDIFASRREYHELCKWWERDESDDTPLEEIDYQIPPKGIFYAKETSPEYNDNNIVGNFMFDRTTVTITSPDNLFDMHRNSVVLYQGDYWIVDSIQKVHYRQKQQEFAVDKHNSHHWVLRMRK